MNVACRKGRPLRVTPDVREFLFVLHFDEGHQGLEGIAPGEAGVAVAVDRVERLHQAAEGEEGQRVSPCLLYTSPSPRDRPRSRMPSSA